MLVKIEVYGGYSYYFTERECEIIEKYFDSIRLYMDDEIVDKIISDIDYYDNDQYVKTTLVAYYDYYLLVTNYYEEVDFSYIMFNEFGVDI